MSLSRHTSPSAAPSARSPSPEFAQDTRENWDSSNEVEMSVSRPPSPPPEAQGDDPSAPLVHCLWDKCGDPFYDLQTLIDHIHNEHIGMNKSTYVCEWATCQRRGMQQASRFALISHIRAHTGEKPFTCPLPECDKSFTRSDAMAKHMRIQHNIVPPMPGRGGNRKRKREGSAEAEENENGAPSLKFEGHTPVDLTVNPPWYDQDDPSPSLDDRNEFLGVPSAQRSTSPSGLSTTSADEREDPLPGYILRSMDPDTGKILGRSPAQVRYLIMKAKHRFVMEQHDNLLEELRVMRAQERQMRELKEEALDDTLRTLFGHKAEFLLRSSELPYRQNGYGQLTEGYGPTNGL